jgi:hypothetical protein
MHQQHQEKSLWTSQSPLTRKRMINTINASTTPRKRFMNIMIMINQKEDHRHKKCISNPKRGVFKSHDLQWPLQSPLEKERKMLEIFL